MPLKATLGNHALQNIVCSKNNEASVRGIEYSEISSLQPKLLAGPPRDDYEENFPVVDLLDNVTGNIISVARGTPEYLWTKIQVLFDTRIASTGMAVAANRPKFKSMLALLKGNNKEKLEVVKDLNDFQNRARLMVPNDAVLSLKAMIMTRVNDEALRDRMLAAIISGI